MTSGNDEWNPFAEDELPAVTVSKATIKVRCEVPHGKESTAKQTVCTLDQEPERLDVATASRTLEAPRVQAIRKRIKHAQPQTRDLTSQHVAQRQGQAIIRHRCEEE